MIKIREPRYRDQTVLVARFRIPAGCDITLEIEKGARKGIYKVKQEDIINSPLERLKTRSGNSIQIRAIPLDYLERVEDENQSQI